MNKLFISDTYGHHEELLLPRGDMIIHAGNLTKDGTEPEVRDFLDWFSHLNYRYRIFISGTRDVLFEKEPELIRRLIPSNVIYLEESGVEINGFKLWGTPYNTANYGNPFSVGPDEIEDHWNKIPDDTDIVIGRTPAFGVQDEDVAGRHMGNKDLLRKLVKVCPRYFVSGNIHGAHRYEYRHHINFVNASLLNEEYEVQNKPVFLK
jgi:hypothetical protein